MVSVERWTGGQGVVSVERWTGGQTVASVEGMIARSLERGHPCKPPAEDMVQKGYLSLATPGCRKRALKAWRRGMPRSSRHHKCWSSSICLLLRVQMGRSSTLKLKFLASGHYKWVAVSDASYTFRGGLFFRCAGSNRGPVEVTVTHHPSLWSPRAWPPARPTRQPSWPPRPPLPLPSAGSSTSPN